MPEGGIPANVPVALPKKKGFPRSFGRYVLEKSLSRGGMGEIFLAVAKGVGARCVIKTIRSDLTGDREFIGRFEDEAKIMVRLGHDNIIRIFDAGKVGGDYYIAMEYTYGRDLGDVLDRAYERGQPMPRDIGCFLARAILGGLDYIHRARAEDQRPMNLVHRDISPQNVLIGFDASVKLIDFGLARTELLPGRTQGALAVGKYGYMSPEQARHEKIDGRADLYSLGVMLFEVFTGDRLVDEQDQATLWARVLNPKHRRPSTVIPDLPKEVDDLIMNAVAVKPDDRFASARDMIGYLDQMSTKSCPPERLTEYLRYLYPHADFNPPPVPVYENDERDAPAASEYSMVIAMSEEGAKSVFGRGELPIEWTRQFALKDLQQGLEQARAEQARLEQERVDRDQARRNKQRERAERPATIEPSLHDPAGITDPRHGDPRMLVAVDEEHDLIPPTAASVSGVVDDSPTTIAQASGALPAGVLADSEATAYARPPAPQRKQQAEVSTRPTIAQSAVVEDRFRDEEMTVMMDAPPSKRGTPWAGEDLTREEIHAPTKVGGGLTTPIVISPESSSQATQPSQPAFSRDNRDSRDRDDKRAKRDIQERKRPGGATAKPAAVMRKTVGFENASKEPPIAPAATPRRPAYMEQSETDELLQSPPEPTPNWLLLGLILMGITIVILLIVLLIQKT